MSIYFGYVIVRVSANKVQAIGNQCGNDVFEARLNALPSAVVVGSACVNLA